MALAGLRLLSPTVTQKEEEEETCVSLPRGISRIIIP